MAYFVFKAKSRQPGCLLFVKFLIELCFFFFAKDPIGRLF
ncbi:hypothetical protein G3A_01810 [Bacillus sp. 17376]|nr:hypothetical protein G3A_01810 [Bacillus sp. 17376]